MGSAGLLKPQSKDPSPAIGTSPEQYKRDEATLTSPVTKTRTLAERRAKKQQLEDRALPPELPRVRTSERGTFKRCHWKWWWEFEEQLKPIHDIPALRFGSLIHKALAAYYPPGIKRGPHPAATFREAYQAELDDLQELFGMKVRRDAEDDEVWVEAGTLGEAMMNHYVERYGKDSQYKVLATEQRFDLLVYKPWTVKPLIYGLPSNTKPEPWFVYCGVVDGVWLDRQSGYIFIEDHKTAKAIIVKYLSLDDQATAYWTWGWDWLVQAGLIKPDVKPAGMMFNIMRKAIKDTRPQNENGHYLNKDGAISKQQPSDYFARVPIYRDWHERESARDRLYREFSDMERVRKEGIGAAYKNPGQFTCPGCWAFDICELDEVGAPGADELREQTTRHWEPYHQREIYAGETK